MCPRCARWNLTPLADRWETLEACERAVVDRGRVILTTPHLALVDVAQGELVRVGEAPRPEFVDWRYGPRVAHARARPGILARLLSRLPPPPVEGYDPYRGVLSLSPGGVWLASPFLEAASGLTYLFTQVPLAPRCPSCADPLALHPWRFQELRLLATGGTVALQAPCALCGTTVEAEMGAARPALRLALGVVTPPAVVSAAAAEAVGALEASGGSGAFLELLAGAGARLGSLDPLHRSGLIIALDELAEAEALESEWRSAEEVAAIMDGELSQVPGFDAFREEVLGEGG